MLKEFVEKHVKWFGQCSLMFTYNNKIIFIDPFNLPENFDTKADFILITHSHFDHLSFKDLQLAAKKYTKLYAPADVVEKLKEAGYTNVELVEPYNKLNLSGIKVATMPMYNVIKTNFHPKENKWVGYILEFDGIKFYVSGDTERIEEMKDLNVDIAFLPIGKVYTMNSVDEAVEAVIDTKAKLAVPIHFGLYEGTDEDAEKFCQLLKKQNIDCLILKIQNY